MVGPFLHVWKKQHPSVSTYQGRYELREILNAIFHESRTRYQWAYLRMICAPHPVDRAANHVPAVTTGKQVPERKAA